jgi:hypothetical protein
MRRTADEKKKELLSDFIEVRQHIFEAASRIPPLHHEQAFLGFWSIKDMLAHLIGWDYANIEATKTITEGRLPAFYAHIDRNWQTYNAYLVVLHKTGEVADLIQNAQKSNRALTDLLNEIPAKELFRDNNVRYRGYKVTMARLIAAETKDEKEHLDQIKAFMAKILADKT